MDRLLTILSIRSEDLAFETSIRCSHCDNAVHLIFQRKGEDINRHIFECKLGIHYYVDAVSDEITRMTFYQILLRLCARTKYQTIQLSKKQALSKIHSLHPFKLCPFFKEVEDYGF